MPIHPRAINLSYMFLMKLLRLSFAGNSKNKGQFKGTITSAPESIDPLNLTFKQALAHAVGFPEVHFVHVWGFGIPHQTGAVVCT